jgi:hypothetical protein
VHPHPISVPSRGQSIKPRVALLASGARAGSFKTDLVASGFSRKIDPAHAYFRLNAEATLG